jgi:hypothetical protein
MIYRSIEMTAAVTKHERKYTFRADVMLLYKISGPYPPQKLAVMLVAGTQNHRDGVTSNGITFTTSFDTFTRNESFKVTDGYQIRTA